MKLTSVTIQDMDFDVEVFPGGQFSCQVKPGVEVTAYTLEDLKEEISKAYSRTKARIDVPFMVLVANGETLKIERHTVTGRHGSNRNWLVMTPHGATQESSFYRSTLRILTYDEQRHLKELYALYMQAKDAYDSYLYPLHDDTEKRAREALTEARAQV